MAGLPQSGFRSRQHWAVEYQNISGNRVKCLRWYWLLSVRFAKEGTAKVTLLTDQNEFRSPWDFPYESVTFPPLFSAGGITEI